MTDYNIELQFRCQWCQGWPKISVELDGKSLCHHEFSNSDESLSIVIPRSIGSRELSIIRYGKTPENMVLDSNGSIIKDQILEIESARVNGSVIPNYIFDQYSQFKFNDQIHSGSRHFGPNGIWSFVFVEPFITWILDQKISHEAKYSNDYIYPWSYKFGPGTVEEILNKIKSTREKVIGLDL